MKKQMYINGNAKVGEATPKTLDQIAIKKMQSELAAKDARIMELEKQIKEGGDESNFLISQNQGLRDKCKGLEKQVAEYEKVLGFYTDRDNWFNGGYDENFNHIDEADWEVRPYSSDKRSVGGKQAREVLERYEKRI